MSKVNTSATVDGGALRFRAAPDELFPDPEQIPEAGVNLWSLGSASYTAAGDPEMPGESRRFLVMAGNTPGRARARASSGGCSSETAVFVAPAALGMSGEAFNIGAPHEPAPPAALSLALSDDDPEAIFTGAAASDGMTCIDPRFGATLAGVSADRRRLDLEVAARPGAGPADLVISTEVRMRHAGRQVKTHRVASAELRAISMRAETATDQFAGGIPSPVAVGEKHTTRIVVVSYDDTSVDVFVETAPGEPETRFPRANDRSFGPVRLWASVTVEDGAIADWDGAPFVGAQSLDRVPAEPGDPGPAFGYLRWMGSSPGEARLVFEAEERGAWSQRAATPPAKVRVVPRVEFFTDAACATPKDELRPGILAARAETVFVRITPGTEAVTFSSSNEARATAAPTGPQTGTAKLTVRGVTLTPATQERDADLVARWSGIEIATLPITVVEPTDFSQTSPHVDNTPAIDPNDPRVIRWDVNVTITILDPFGAPLGRNWSRLLISERVTKPGGTVFGPPTGFRTLAPDPLSDGTVIDPVFQAIKLLTPDIAQAMLQGYIPFPELDNTFQQKILVKDGEQPTVTLPAVNSRRAIVTKGVLTLTNSH